MLVHKIYLIGSQSVNKQLYLNNKNGRKEKKKTEIKENIYINVKKESK